jgi:hypothetical protein
VKEPRNRVMFSSRGIKSKRSWVPKKHHTPLSNIWNSTRKKSLNNPYHQLPRLFWIFQGGFFYFKEEEQ